MPKKGSTSYTLLPASEEEPLNPSSSPQTRTRFSRRWTWQWTLPGILAAAVFVALIVTHIKKPSNDAWSPSKPDGPACPQYSTLSSTSESKKKLEKELADELSSDNFLENALKRVQGAVQIPTESFDDMGKVGEDKRWDIFADFHKYLEKTFPLVWSKLDVTTINTYGILIEWKGKKDSLKPYLFMGHQDVVPVLAATESRWKYPPYSAHYDGRFIWGRGVCDCKSIVIGVLEAFETLLEKGYQPERTMLAGFGFDEEISGWQGAAYISKHLEDTRGKDSIDLIIDEGGGIAEIYGAMFALPGLGEKGYLDVRITVETAGGHSSIPPDHTSIGILSQIISTIEGASYEPELTPINPYFTTLQCAAEFAPNISDWLRKTILKALTSKKAARSVANYVSEKDIRQRYLMQTSQAVDLISGGVKINALPEKVSAVVNHRIAVESHTKIVRKNLQSLITDNILKRFPLSLNAWGNVTGNTSNTSTGQVTLEDFDKSLEPSPVSPLDTDAYKTFSGTIKQVFGHEYIVAPSLMTGNTDTKFYWNLTKNIYRFSPIRDDGWADIHTVDERLGLRDHVEGVRFYAQMVLNGDAE